MESIEFISRMDPLCHSERSEESLPLSKALFPRCFASLRMTNVIFNMKTKIEKSSLSRHLVGIEGVYYAAAKLTHEGYIALVTIRNTKAYDLLIFKQGQSKILPIQVKTSSRGGFRVVTIENIKTMNEELDKKIICPFVLVDLNKENDPKFFILNEKQMKELIKKDWGIWEKEHKHYKPLKTTDVQIIFQLKETIDLLGAYRDKWKNLSM